MFVITHALAPVVVANTLSAWKLTQSATTRMFSKVHLTMIGIAGASPDLLWPHWKLSARLQSPTHTLWYLFAIYPLCLLAGSWLGGRQKWLIAHSMWLAVLLHLICDAAAGGIAWLYPVSNNVVGGSFIPLPLWLLSDVFLLLASVLLQHAVNDLEMKRFRRTMPCQ